MEFDDENIRLSKDKEGFLRYIFKNNTEAILKDTVISFIRSKWDYISGDLSLHTWPIKYSGKKLTVRVEKSVYAQELNMYMNWIMDRLKDLGVPVESIKIETGPLNGFFPSGYNDRKKKDMGGSENEKRDLTSAQENLLTGLEKLTS